MTAITFDSLKYVERLTTAGVSEPQAKAMSEAQKEVFTEMVEDQLATKLDIAGLNNKIDLDIATLNNKIDVSVAMLNNKIDVAIAGFNGKFNLLYWMFGFQLAFAVTILFKLFA